MDHRKHPGESETGPDGYLAGRKATGARAGHTEPENPRNVPETKPARRVAPKRGRKRFVPGSYRRPHDSAAHPPADHELRHSQRELRRLSVQLLTIQEKERQRIAADLHDGIGQSLSLIKLSVESGLQLMAAGESGKACELMQGVVHKVNDAMAELRRTTADLRPPMLDDLGIIPTLTWFFRELEPVCRGKSIEKEVAIAESDVPAPLKATIFRILQEAMNNVVKHADADRVRVCLKKAGAAIQFSIEDNGRGFDPAAAVPGRRQGGFGLLTMKERAISSDGVFEVESAPGQGTRVAVTWQPADSIPGCARRAMPPQDR